MNKSQCKRVPEIIEEIIKFCEENKLFMFIKILIMPNKLYTNAIDTNFCNSQHTINKEDSFQVSLC